MRRRLLIVALILLAACNSNAGERQIQVADSSVRQPDPYPAEAPPEWHRSRVPPPQTLVRRGACPFECCVYGEWWSDSATTVYRTARDTSSVAFSLPARTPITAEEGTLYVTSLARVVFDSTMGPEQLGLPDLTLTPADTIYLVQPIGEGAFIVWLRGQEFELPGEWEYGPRTRARREGEYRGDWWVRIRAKDGRSGWVWMNRTRAPMWGADACGGPHPLPN